MWGLLVAAVIGIFGSFGSVFGGSVDEYAGMTQFDTAPYTSSYFDDGFQTNATSAAATPSQEPEKAVSAVENVTDDNLPLVDVSRPSAAPKTTDKAEDGDAVTVLAR